jgi:hypothetical protein
MCLSVFDVAGNVRDEFHMYVIQEKESSLA